MKRINFIFMLLLMVTLNTVNLSAATSERTVSDATLSIESGGGSDSYDLDDEALYTSGGGYDVSSTDNYLRSYDKGSISLSFIPEELGTYTMTTTIHAPGQTVPAVDKYGDYKYLMSGGIGASDVSSEKTVSINSALLNSNIKIFLDDYEFYNVVNGEIIEFTTVITSPSGVETVVTTDNSVDSDYYVDFDLTASASSNTYLDISLNGSTTPVSNPTGDASLGSSGVMLTANVAAGVQGPNGTIVGGQELDATKGYSEQF